MNTSLQVVGNNDWAIIREQAEMLIKTKFLPTAITTAEQAIAIILTGRELGIPTMAALRSIDVIQGKPSVSPQLMLALIKRSGQLEDINLSSGVDGAICTMKRKGNLSHTVSFGPKEAKALGLDGKDNYKKQAPTMYQWRAVAAAARAVFPDVILGLYTPDEMGADVDVDSGESVDGEVVSVVESLPAPEPSPEEKVQAEIQSVCALLNEAGDDIKWTGTTLKKYIAGNFNSPKPDEMTPAMYKGLLGRLKLRLDALNAQVKEVA